MTPDGHPTATWWVHRDYAAMTGTKILADGNAPQLPAFATRASNGEIDVLVGNDFGCSNAVTPNCPANAPLAGPIAPAMAVHLPIDAATNYTVAVDRIAYRAGAMDQPDHLLSPPATFLNGVLTLSLPTMAGGEALFVRLVPSGRGPGPLSPGPFVDPSVAHLGSALSAVPDPTSPGGIISWAW
jgi:hypothetical protein